MSMVADQEPASPQRSVVPDTAIKDDRRRPGRAEVDPVLIPLLRGTTPLVEPQPVKSSAYGYAGQASFDFRTKPGLREQAHLAGLDDGGDLMRAIRLGGLLSLPFWAVAAVLCYWLLA